MICGQVRIQPLSQTWQGSTQCGQYGDYITNRMAIYAHIPGQSWFVCCPCIVQLIDSSPSNVSTFGR
jgi:hypothetical protein